MNGFVREWMIQQAGKVPSLAWGPFVAGILILLVGAVSLVAGQPWLFPSLGPTVFLQTENPELPSSRFYNTVVGHMVGLSAAFLAVVVTGAADAPSVLSSGYLVEARLWASVAAVMLSLFFMMLLHASHPPSAATTLLITLGGFSVNMHDALTILVGVVIISVSGEWFRQLRFQTL